MTLRLITGRANAGKTGRVYGLVRSAGAAGRGAIVVLPTVPDVLRARAELCRDVPLGLTVTTFHGLVASLWEQFGDGRGLVNDAQRDMILASIAREQGRSRAMARLGATCAVQLTEATGEGWRSAEPDPHGAGLQLTELLAAYAQHLGRASLIEQAEAARHLASQQISHDHLLAVHRFSDFTPSQVELLKGISSGCEVVVALTWERGFCPTAALDSVVGELEPLAEVEVAEEPAHLTHPTLDDLGRSLFSDVHVLPDDQAVRFALAEGGEAEARQIAEEIRRALADGTATAADRIAVAFRNPSAHDTELRHVFDEAGIEADYDIPVAFGQVPFGMAYLDLLAFAINGKRAPLLNLLRSPFSGVEAAAARELERQWRSANLQEPAILLGGVESVSKRLRETLTGLRRIATNPLATQGCGILSTAARSLFSAAYGADSDSGARGSQLDARAHASVMSLLSEVASMPQASVWLADVFEALSAAEITPSQVERAGRVQVMPITRLRGRRFETVVIGGMNAGEFPASPIETALIGSAVGSVLAQFGGSGDEGGGHSFERLLFYEAVSRAKNRLVLSARAADADGEALQRSPFFEAVEDFYRTEGDDEIVVAHSYKRIGDSLDTQCGLSPRESLRLAAEQRAMSEPLVRAAIRRTGCRPGILTDPDRKIDFDSTTVFSASQIQAYVRCPYRWFYEYFLSPRELERGFDARDEGELAHALLAETYEQLIDDGAVPLTSANLAAAYEVLEARYRAQTSQQGKAISLEQQVGRRHALEWARRVLAEDANRSDGYAPMLIEWEFGYDDDPLDMGGYLLRGRIDRIDADRDGRAIVTDYKRTCTARHGAGKMLTGGLVQVPLYLEAVRRGTRLSPVAGVYRGLAKQAERGLVMAGSLDSSRTTSTDVREPDAYQALIDEALSLCADAVSGMRAGVIAPAPFAADSCSGCPVANACGARQ